MAKRPKTCCTVILSRGECAKQRKAYGSSCQKKAVQFFRVERTHFDPVIIGRCKDHQRDTNHVVSIGINDNVVSRLTPEEVLVAEIHDV
jgi:hypothetical protein